MAIDILVCDTVVSCGRVEHAVRRALRDVGPTNVTVALLPSDRDGRWDLGLRNADGWSLTSFDAPVEELATRAVTAVRQLLLTAGRNCRPPTD